MRITESLLRKIIQEEYYKATVFYGCGHCDNGIRAGSHSDEKKEHYCDCLAGQNKRKEKATMMNSKSDLEKYSHERY